MEEQVRERHPAQCDRERCHVREVGLRIHARPVDLGEDDLLARAVLGTPGGDLPLQRAELHCLVSTGGLVAQDGKQRGRLQRGISFKLLGDPRPVRFKRVRPRAVATRPRELAGQAAAPLIGPGRAHTHPGSRRGLLLGPTFGSFSQHAEDLQVPFHGALLHEGHPPGPSPRSSAQSAILVFVGGSSNCR